MKTKWQKNFRAIPDMIIEKAKQIKGNNVVVAVAKKIPKAEIESGTYAHLGIRMKSGKPAFEHTVLPTPDVGRFSHRNINGLEIVRRDLPMTAKTYSVETPDWGDWSKGSHTVEWTRDVYQRDSDPPRENEIEIRLVGAERHPDPQFVFQFIIPEVLNKTSKDFKDALFYNLNLLQENVGAADVFPSKASAEDYLKSLYVTWEILPPGESDSNINRIVAAIGVDTPEIRKRVVDRYKFFESLKPECLIQGQGGFRRYFGGKFSDNLVIFENLQYGNAVYAMFREWERYSKLTKQEVLSSGLEGKDYIRVPHAAGWKDRVRAIAKNRR